MPLFAATGVFVELAEPDGLAIGLDDEVMEKREIAVAPLHLVDPSEGIVVPGGDVGAGQPAFEQGKVVVLERSQRDAAAHRGALRQSGTLAR